MDESWEFSEPVTREEAFSRLDTLKEEKQDIEAQLGSRGRTDESGRRLTGPEYFTWREKAVYAKTYKEREIRRLKSWLRDHLPVGEDKPPLRETLARMEDKLDEILDLLSEPEPLGGEDGGGTGLIICRICGGSGPFYPMEINGHFLCLQCEAKLRK